MGKIIEKVKKFVKSPKTQRVAKASAKFIKDTGLAQKGVDFINQKVSKKTKKNQLLDPIREELYQGVSKHTKPTVNSNLVTSTMNFLNEADLFSRQNNTYQRLAASTPKKSTPFSRSGVDILTPRRANQLYDFPNHIFFPPEKSSFR